MRGFGWGWKSWFWPYCTLYFASSFGRTLHRLELLGPYFKTRDLPFLSNTNLKTTLRATLVGTFFDLLQENWVQNGGVFTARVYMVSSGCRSAEASSESSRDKVTVQCSAIYLGFALGMVNSCSISVKQQQIRWFDAEISNGEVQSRYLR